MNPRYPVYIISKGRWESRLTSKALEKMNVPYHIAIEPQEYDAYAAVIDPKKILVTPFSNLGQGSIPVRNFIWEHSIANGHKRHWCCDDNIRDWCRMNRNIKPRVKSGTIFRVMEDFVDRYENVAMAGPQYFMFTPRKVAHPAFTLNTRIYSCILIDNSLKHRWRGKYNEDTDLSIRCLKEGWCTILFYAFIQDKMPTLTMKGGNMEQLYAIEDGRLKMAQSLVEQHPDVTRIYWRWGRWQHLVDYTGFQKMNKLVRKKLDHWPQGVDNYGMEIEIKDEPDEPTDPTKPRKKPLKRVRPTVEVVTLAPPSPPIADNHTPLPELDGIDSLGFDTETTTEAVILDRKIVGYSYYLPDGREGYIPIRHPGGGNYDEAVVKRWVQCELRDKQLIGANLKYEVHVTRNEGIDLEEQGCVMRDVFHQAALLNDHRFRTNLSVLMQEELPGQQRIEIDHANFWRMPAAQVAAAATEDARLAFQLNAVYEPKIETEELERVLQLEDDLIFASVEMERNGAYLDIEKLLRFKSEIATEIEQRLLGLKKEVGFEVDTGSWKSMQRLFDHLKIDYPRTEASETHPEGCPSFTEEFLDTVQHPVALMAKECRQMASYKAKFIDAYEERVVPHKDNRLFYTLHQLRGDKYGTITGRYSSSQSDDGIGVNIQQVALKKKQPKLLQRWNIRELFLPPKGRIWLSADAAQIELRIMAHYAAVFGMRRLQDEYRKDPWVDFHLLMVAWTGLIRDIAKNVTFAKQYGAGVDKIAYMCGVSRREAQKIVDQYDRQFPEPAQLLAMASRQAEKIGYVRTMLGRRRRYQPGDRMYSAWNAVDQGTAADINKLKVLAVYRQRKKLDLTMRMTVHDEVDGDIASREAAAPIQHLLNEQALELEVPILWECGTGPNWGDIVDEPKEAITWA